MLIFFFCIIISHKKEATWKKAPLPYQQIQMLLTSQKQFNLLTMSLYCNPKNLHTKNTFIDNTFRAWNKFIQHAAEMFQSAQEKHKKTSLS